MTAGLVLIVVGVWVISQLLFGNALKRLGL
jgi:hypothetical protein